ncbi:MAG: hypothetical protein L3J69_06670 [Desulfobacula sp.]|nr:hypothetical protein [Desulfobacula sp.]
MITKLGIYSLITGLFIGLFSGISSFMVAENIWVNLTFSKILGEDKTESIVTFFSSVAVQDSLDYFFYDLPVFLFTIGLGILLLLISLFLKDHQK